MDSRQLFADERHASFCIFCGGPPTTREHVASRVLLDDPLPDNLPIGHSCHDCNNGFSKDEDYLACLIDCVISGSTEPGSVQREKVRTILRRSPALGARIANGRVESNGHHVWKPDEDRVRSIVLKLARGHVAYEYSEPRLDLPEEVTILPLSLMTAQERRTFETVPASPGWPEIGSRAFIKACYEADLSWTVLQEGRYRYCVAEPGEVVVRIVMSEYLACEVVWQ